MSCSEIRPRLSEFVDGRLTVEEAEAVEAHNARCAECAAVARDFATMKRMLAGTAVPRPAPEFWDQALSRAREGRRPRWQAPSPGLLRWQRAAAYTAAAAALVLAVVAPTRLLRRGEQEPAGARQVIAWHANYCSRQPLTATGFMRVLALRAQSDQPD